AKTLELFTGSDRFGEVEKRKAGMMTEADYDCLTIMAMNGKAAADVKCDVELPMETFTATAEMAGLSRVMGGYHIQADNIEGLNLGRKVANYEWPRIQAYFNGTAAPRP
nr:haloperoxidase [Acidobacteriota bacterium]